MIRSVKFEWYVFESEVAHEKSVEVDLQKLEISFISVSRAVGEMHVSIMGNGHQLERELAEVPKDTMSSIYKFKPDSADNAIALGIVGYSVALNKSSKGELYLLIDTMTINSRSHQGYIPIKTIRYA